MAGLPLGATSQDIAEYMLGEVYVSVVFMESNGTGLNNTENWNEAQKAAVKSNIIAGHQWWEDTLALAQGANPNPNLLNFTFDFSRADNPVPTSSEPIRQTSSAFTSWVVDFFNQPDVKSTLTAAGLTPSGDFSTNLKAFNNAQRLANNADWAYTIFVVNDANDADHQFATPGFPLAFSFAGRTIVSLASRPASTYAHEMGIVFWARDEYPNSGHYTDHRGYYDAQNLNAADGNPNPAAIVPSIMAVHAPAFANPDLTGPTGRLAVSTMHQIGWKDSDGDGIFDVLDVPHALAGSGYYDAAAGRFRFHGSSTVRTLPNENPLFSAATPYASSLQNDITINRLSRVEFRLNGEGNPWQTFTTLSDRPTSTALDLSIPVPANFQSIEIRTVDDRTKVVSDVFSGGPAGPTSVLQAGLNGFVRHDLDANGQLSTDELGLYGWTVRLVDANSQPITLQKSVEPDDFALGTVLNTVPGVPEITLTALGSNVGGSSVVVRDGDLHPTGGQPLASTLSRVFRRLAFGSTTSLSASWTEDARLRVDFASPVTTVSLDAVANSASDFGRLDAFDASDNLVARYTTKSLGLGQFETMTVSAAAGNIKYVVAKGHMGTSVSLDNLKFGAKASTTTDLRGAWSLPNLPAGTYRVEMTPPTGGLSTTPSVQTATLAGGASVAGLDFGGRFTAGAFPLRNPVNRFDVDGNDAFNVSDVFELISMYRLRVVSSGGLPLPDFEPSAAPLAVPPPFVDVSADNIFDVRDILALVAEFRVMRGGSSSGGSGGSGSGGGGGEGEAAFVALPQPAAYADSELTGSETIPRVQAAAQNSLQRPAISPSKEGISAMAASNETLVAAAVPPLDPDLVAEIFSRLGSTKLTEQWAESPE